MDFLHDFALGALMLFVGFIVFDWGRIWWYARRHGVIRYHRNGKLYDLPASWSWANEYLGYKVWTWFIRIATWLIALWHVSIAVCWFVELAFAVSVS